MPIVRHTQRLSLEEYGTFLERMAPFLLTLARGPTSFDPRPMETIRGLKKQIGSWWLDVLLVEAPDELSALHHDLTDSLTQLKFLGYDPAGGYECLALIRGALDGVRRVSPASFEALGLSVTALAVLAPTSDQIAEQATEPITNPTFFKIHSAAAQVCSLLCASVATLFIFGSVLVLLDVTHSDQGSDAFVLLLIVGVLPAYIACRVLSEPHEVLVTNGYLILRRPFWTSRVSVKEIASLRRVERRAWLVLEGGDARSLLVRYSAGVIHIPYFLAQND